MIRLVAVGKDANVDLDVPDVSIELNFQIEDLRTPGKRYAPFSLTFKLPFTQVNTKFFTGVHEPNFTSGAFDINKKTEASLYDGSVRLFKGIIQVTSIDLQLGKFNCRFYAAGVDFFQAIRGKRWRDVWTDVLGNLACPLDHTLNATNVYNTWTNANPTDIDPTVPVGTIRYPLTDNGGHPVGDGQQPGALIEAWEGGIVPTNLHPAVRVSYLISELCKYAGYTHLNDFFTDASIGNDNLYVLVGLQSRIVDSRASYGWFVTGSVDTTSSGNALEPFQIVNFNSVDPPNYDPDDMWANSTAYVTLPLLGAYFIEVTISSQDTINGQYNSEFVIEGSNGNTGATFPFVAGNIDDTPLTLTFVVQNNVANQPYFFIIYTAADAVFDVTMQYVNFQSFQTQDAVLDFATIMGDEPVDKWVKGLVETYNLVVQVDEDDRTIEFTTYDEYYQQADPVDWTDRVDLSGRRELLPASDYQQARLTLTPAEAEDHRNKYYENTFGVRKGQFVRVTDGDFSEGDVTLNDFYGLMRLTYLKWFVNPYTGVPTQTQFGVSTPIIISELWATSGRLKTEYEALPPMLCYYHGTQNNIADYPVLIGNIDPGNNLPLFTTYSGTASDSYRVALEYATSAPDLADTSVIGNPTAGLLEAYWYQYIESIYAPTARVLKCMMRLSPSDIQGLNFAQPINIENLSYRLISISNYVVGSDGLCNVELFRTEVVSGKVRCELRPSIGRNGLVVWFDADGNQVAGSELCCTSYGWEWNPDNRVCNAFPRRTTDVQGMAFSTPAIASYGLHMALEGEVTEYDNYLTGRVTEEVWQMSVTTTNNTPTTASTIQQGQTLFLVGSQKSVNIIVEWIAVRTSGSNLGETSSGEEAVLLNTIDNTTTRADGQVYGRGTALDVEIVSSDGTDGSKWQVQCTGIAATDIEWFLSVKCLTYDGTTTFRPAIPAYAIFQNNDTYLFENGDDVVWNA
jgi:hypothetical protein